VWKVNSTGHPISKSNPIKSRVTEDVFLKCGKQEKTSILGWLQDKTFSIWILAGKGAPVA